MAFFDDLPHPEDDSQFYDGVPAKRAAAWLIDFAITLIASLAFTLVVGIATLGLGFLFFYGILFVVTFAYRTLTIAQFSATPGMQLMGIELRTRTGDRFDLLLAAFHTGIFMFLVASVIGWILTVISILVTRYNQGLPDLVLGSTAINVPIE